MTLQMSRGPYPRGFSSVRGTRPGRRDAMPELESLGAGVFEDPAAFDAMMKDARSEARNAEWNQ